MSAYGNLKFLIWKLWFFTLSLYVPIWVKAAFKKYLNTCCCGSVDHPHLLQWSTGSELYSKPWGTIAQLLPQGEANFDSFYLTALLSCHCILMLAIFFASGLASPSLGRWGFWMYTAHFYSDPGSLVLGTAKVVQAPNQQTNSPPLTPLWPSDLSSQTWPTLHRGALQGPTGVCRIGLVYGELCFWLRGTWRLLLCVGPFAPSGKNSGEALGYCSSRGKMASLRGLGETVPLCKTLQIQQLFRVKIDENLPWCEAACSAVPTQTQQELGAGPVRSHPDKSVHQDWLEGRMMRFLSEPRDFYQSREIFIRVWWQKNRLLACC